MLRSKKWILVITGALLTTTLARADLSAQPDLLTQRVDHDLFFSYLNTNTPDRFQNAFKYFGVETAPSNPPLSAGEQAQLIHQADKLWNREYELIQLKKATNPPKTAAELDQQRALIKSAVKEYNKRIEDIVAERSASGWSASIAHPSKIQACHDQLESTPPPAILNLAGDVAPLILPAIHAAQVVEEKQDPAQPLLVQQAPAASAVAAPISAPASAVIPQASTPVKINLPGSDTSFASDFVMSMTKDPSNSSSVYGISGASGAKYLLHSNDGGKTWSRLSALSSTFFADDNLYDHLAIGAGGKEVFLTTSQGVFQSSDSGNSFGPFLAASSSFHAASDVKLSADGSHLAVSYGNVTSPDSDLVGSNVTMFEKNNGVWQKSSAQPTDLTTFSNQKFAQDSNCSGNGDSDSCPYIDGHVQVLSVQTDPTNPQIIYAGTGRGIYRWQPGSGWSILKGVWGDTTVYNIDIAPSTGELMISGCNGVYHGKVDQPGSSILPDSQVALSKFRSASFLDQSNGNESDAGYLRTYDVVSRDSNSKEIVATGASGVYFSKDGGGTWKRASGGDLPQTYEGADAEFRSAVWLADGSVEVSGPSGTYQFTP